MRPEILFIYHGKCYDGFTAAWVFDHFRKKGLSIIDQPVTYVPASYGSDPPDCKGKEVWIVDFSYPRDVLINKVIIPSMRTVILDHHKTAEADLKGILGEIRDIHNLQRQTDKVIFDMNRSGAGILYDELAREWGKKAGQHIPSPTGERSLWLVDYIEDRDLWKWKKPNSKEVSAYYASVPMTFEWWNTINSEGQIKAQEAGRHIQRYIDNYGVKACDTAKIENIDGNDVPTINIPYMNCSDHIGRLAELYPDHPFAAGYFRRSDGRWQFSLRSRKNNFDVSAVAKKFGGGGHAEAAGFDVAVLPWVKLEPLSPDEIVHLGENSE